MAYGAILRCIQGADGIPEDGCKLFSKHTNGLWPIVKSSSLISLLGSLANVLLTQLNVALQIEKMLMP